MSRGNDLDAMGTLTINDAFRKGCDGCWIGSSMTDGAVGDKRLAWFECTLSYFIG